MQQLQWQYAMIISESDISMLDGLDQFRTSAYIKTAKLIGSHNCFCLPRNIYQQMQHSLTMHGWLQHTKSLVVKQVLAPGQIFFSVPLSAAQCKVEHTIGIWKARFPFLRQLRNWITGKQSVTQLIRFVKSSAVLHNLFVHKHAIPKSWLSMENLMEPDFDDVLDENIFES